MIECPLLKKCKEDGISDKKRKEVKKNEEKDIGTGNGRNYGDGTDRMRRNSKFFSHSI